MSLLSTSEYEERVGSLKTNAPVNKSNTLCAGLLVLCILPQLKHPKMPLSEVVAFGCFSVAVRCCFFLRLHLCFQKLGIYPHQSVTASECTCFHCPQHSVLVLFGRIDSLSVMESSQV